MKINHPFVFTITILLSVLFLTNCKGNPEELLQQAETLRKEGKYVEAREKLDKVLEIESNHVAFKEYGNYYFHYEKDYDMAIEYFQKSLALKPDYINAIHNIGASYIKKFEEVKNTDHPEPEYLEKAREWLDKALEQDPGFPLSLQEYANYYFYKKNYTKALEYCDKALKNGAETASVHMLMGQIYLIGKKNYKEALTHFSAAYAKFNEHAPLLYFLAKTHKELNNHLEMEAYYDKYLKALRKMDVSAEVLEKAQMEKADFKSNS
ncbi:MAG: tetratricopeptide repeat protein [Leptospirales bacterium]